MAGLINKNESESFIVNCFEEFYKQVLRHKKFVLSNPWEKAEDEATSSPNATAEYILSKLQTFLEEQASTVSYGGGVFSENYYRGAQYIMVALADEVFLSLDWPGKPYWESNLLEKRLFNTHSAGQEFFEKLDQLIDSNDPVLTDLAILYLTALGLGFQGKYRHSNDLEALDAYRKKLFVFINRREPYLFREKVYIFPEAYAHTLEGNVAKELPTTRNWYLIFFGLGLAYFLASYIIWYGATADITRTVNRIIAYSGLGG